jgi:hypothetical protein
MSIEVARDKVAIQDVIVSHGLFADCREFAAIKNCVTPDATYDYSSCFGEDFKCVRLSDFLEGDDVFFLGFDATQHMITNFVIQLDGDRASARSHVRATHRIDQAIYVMGGLYRHELARVGSDWKISATTFEQTFTEGDTTLFGKAAARVQSRKATA